MRKSALRARRYAVSTADFSANREARNSIYGMHASAYMLVVMPQRSELVKACLSDYDFNDPVCVCSVDWIVELSASAVKWSQTSSHY